MLNMLKSKASPYIPLKMFVLYASEIWKKLYSPNFTNFEHFEKKKKKKKKKIFKTILDKALTPFWKAFLWLKLFFDA